MIKSDKHYNKVIFTEHGEVSFDANGVGTGDQKAEKVLAGFDEFEVVPENKPTATEEPTEEATEKEEPTKTPAKRSTKKATPKEDKK